jgi:HEPN domain-containing protein
MEILAGAWRHRRSARVALGEGRFAEAALHARAAQELAVTTAGSRLERVIEWMGRLGAA